MEDVNLYHLLTEPEQKVWDWLVKHDITFDHQYRVPQLGGRWEIGSATVDFMLHDRNLALRVQGTYWHSKLEASARDELSKIRIEALGYKVIDLWSDNLTADKINHTMRMAVEQGQEVPR